MPDYENLAQKDTRWTPVTAEVIDLIERCRREGGSQAVLARVAHIKPRQIYRLRKGQQKCVSYNVLDKLLHKSSISHLIDTLPWYTIEELTEKGLWDQPLPHVTRSSS